MFSSRFNKRIPGINKQIFLDLKSMISKSISGFDHKINDKYQIIFDSNFNIRNNSFTIQARSLLNRKINYDILFTTQNTIKVKINKLMKYHGSIGELIGLNLIETNSYPSYFSRKTDDIKFIVKINENVYYFDLEDIELKDKSTPLKTVIKTKVDIKKIRDQIKEQKEKEEQARKEKLKNIVLVNDFGQELKIDKVIIIFNNQERKMVYGKIYEMKEKGFIYTTHNGKKYECRSYKQTYVPEDQEQAENEMALQVLRH